MATNTTEELYLLDTLDNSEFHFDGGTDDLKLSEGGFIPALCTIDGGADSFSCYTPPDTTTDNILAAEDNIHKWLERARERHLSGRKGVYLVFERYGQTLNRRAKVRGGTCLKGDYSSGARSEGTVTFTVTIDHAAPELDEEWTFKNLVLNPSFEYDTNDDGLADNWTDLGNGAPVFSMGTGASNTYHGRRNQVVDSAGGVANQGIKTGNLAVTSGVVYAYGYRARSSAGDIKMEIRNSATHAVLDTLTLSATSTLTRSRDAWTATLTGNIYLALYNESDANPQSNYETVFFWVRNTYTGQQGSAQDYDTGIWVDYYSLNNHDDWSWDNTNRDPEGVDEQNSTNRETLDIIDFPGQLPPKLDVQMHYNTSSILHPFVGLLNHQDVGKTFQSYQAEDATRYGAVALATQDGASGPAANNCLDCPLGAAIASLCSWGIDDDDIVSMAGKTFRVYLIARRKDAYDFDIEWGISSPVYEGQAGLSLVGQDPTDTFTADITTTWKMFAGPTITFAPQPGGLDQDGDMERTYLMLYASQASSYDIYIDRILLMPVDGFLALPYIHDDGRSAYVSDATYYLLMNDDGGFMVLTSNDEIALKFVDAYGSGFSRYRLQSDEIRLLIHQSSRHAAAEGGENRPCDIVLNLRPRYHSL